MAETRPVPVNPRPAKSDTRLYLIRYTLSDGKHLMRGHSHNNIDEAWKRYQHIADSHNASNPHDPMTITAVEPTTPAGIEQAIEELRNENPSRPLATDEFPDQPARINHRTPEQALAAQQAAAEAQQNQPAAAPVTK